MRFGLMVGPSVNWLNADANDWTSETRIRWSYGLMADFFMTDRYALSTRMTIASRQAHLDYQILSVNTLWDLWIFRWF